MSSNSKQSRTSFRPSPNALWLVLLAAAGTFALTMCVRQTMGLYLSSLSTTTGLGLKEFVNHKLIGVTDIDGSF